MGIFNAEVVGRTSIQPKFLFHFQNNNLFPPPSGIFLGYHFQRNLGISKPLGKGPKKTETSSLILMKYSRNKRLRFNLRSFAVK
jgi:hypothetical protein